MAVEAQFQNCEQISRCKQNLPKALKNLDVESALLIKFSKGRSKRDLKGVRKVGMAVQALLPETQLLKVGLQGN